MLKTFVYITICLFSLCFAPDFEAQRKIDNRNRAPSLSDLEGLFGKPVSCIPPFQACPDKSGKDSKCPEPEGVICFQNSRKIIIQAEFNSQNYAKTVRIFDAMNFFQTVRAAEEIIMIHGRGRILKKADRLSKESCESEYIEEYEFLSMHFVSKRCQDAMPGGVTINWKEK